MYQRSTYLMHYGVLGMKWGQRRARHYAIKAKNTNNREKSDKYANKSKRIEQKHIDRAGSKEVYNRVKNQSTAKLLGKSAIIGTYGTLNYERARAKGYSRGRSYLAGLTSETLNSLTGGFRASYEPRITAAAKETKK